MDLRPDQHRSLFHKGRRRDFPVHVGAMDAPAISMGSTNAIRLAFLLRDCAGEYLHRGGATNVCTQVNDEIRMTKLETKLNKEARKAGHWRKIFGDSCFVIDSSFVIRHSSFCL
jgi:hypothetical protein